MSSSAKPSFRAASMSASVGSQSSGSRVPRDFGDLAFAGVTPNTSTEEPLGSEVLISSSEGREVYTTREAFLGVTKASLASFRVTNVTLVTFLTLRDAIHSSSVLPFFERLQEVQHAERFDGSFDPPFVTGTT